MKISYRLAIWRVYNQSCFYCRQPIDWAELHIDHILPQALVTRREKMLSLKMHLNLDSDFTIDSLCNRVPTHQHCNRRKSDNVYDDNVLLFFLQETKKKVPLIKKEIDKIENQSRKDNLLTSIKVGLESGFINKEDVYNALQRSEFPKTEQINPLVICFGLNIFELQKFEFLPSGTSSYYPNLCDYLEEELINNLKRLIKGSFFQPEVSGRDGETLSVRIAFIDLNLDEIDGLNITGWQILDIMYYSEIYGEPLFNAESRRLLR